MKHNLKLITVLLITSLILSGCLYPKSKLSKNQVPNQAQLDMMQSAVEQYKEKNGGLVPIKTKASDVPLYEKYIVDFDQLQQEQIISEIPGTAFENGGYYQYVIVSPEEDPQVKLIDLRMTEQLRSVKVKIDMFRSTNTYPPFANRVQGDVYDIDYKKIGLKEAPTVTSPYSQDQLPIVMDESGNAFIDYRRDLYTALNEFEHNFEMGDNITSILVDNYPFVPAYSIEYTIDNGDPIFLQK